MTSLECLQQQIQWVLGDTTGLYHGTQQINQGQMDRWNIVSTLNYLPFEKELEIILAKNKTLIIKMVKKRSQT